MRSDLAFYRALYRGVTFSGHSVKHNRRLKQRDSLPINAARRAVGSEVPKCGPGARLL